MLYFHWTIFYFENRFALFNLYFDFSLCPVSAIIKLTVKDPIFPAWKILTEPIATPSILQKSILGFFPLVRATFLLVSNSFTASLPRFTILLSNSVSDISSNCYAMDGKDKIKSVIRKNENRITFNKAINTSRFLK